MRIIGSESREWCHDHTMFESGISDFNWFEELGDRHCMRAGNAAGDLAEYV